MPYVSYVKLIQSDNHNHKDMIHFMSHEISPFRLKFKRDTDTSYHVHFTFCVTSYQGKNYYRRSQYRAYDTRVFPEIPIPVFFSHDPENPVGAGRYNISFSQCMNMTVLVEIITINMATLEIHFHRITMLMKTTFTKVIFICLFLYFVNTIF